MKNNKNKLLNKRFTATKAIKMKPKLLFSTRKDMLERLLLARDFIGSQHSTRDKTEFSLTEADTWRYVWFHSETDNWFVSHFDKGDRANPTMSYQDAGPFKTEFAAFMVAAKINQAIIRKLIARFAERVIKEKST